MSYYNVYFFLKLYFYCQAYQINMETNEKTMGYIFFPDTNLALNRSYVNVECCLPYQVCSCQPEE